MKVDNCGPFETIKVRCEAKVLTVWLDRPDFMNAWTHKMGAELDDIMQRAEADDAIRAIIMTGSGKGFCAGADMNVVLNNKHDDAQEIAVAERNANWVRRVRASKPVIAAVNGAAVGMGLTLILPFDFILASEQAKFLLPFASLGLVPEFSSSHFLERRIGFSRTNEMLLLGKKLSAEQAVEIGLVDKLSSKENLMRDAMAIAQQLASKPVFGMLQAKRLITENGYQTDLDLIHRREQKMLSACMASDDFAAAVAAMQKKSK